jgi:methyl-accepting chemotaxis protein
MFEAFRKKLWVKIVLSLLVVEVVFGLLMYFYVRHNNQLRRDAEMRLFYIHCDTVIRIFSKDGNVQMGLTSANTEIFTDQIKNLNQDPTISYLVIYDDKNQVLYKDQNYEKLFKLSESDPQTGAYRFPDLAQYEKLAEGLVKREWTTGTHERMLELVKEVKMKVGETDQLIGQVRIGISLAAMDQEIRNALWQGYGIIAALLGLGLVFVLVSIRVVMPPISRLANAAREIGQGRFDLQLPVTSSDELGLLTETFNEMVRSIKDQTGQLQAMIKSITEAIKLLTATTTELLSISTQQAAGATEQAAIVQEVVSTTEEFAATADRIADTAGAVSDAASRTWDAAQQGKEFMENSMAGMGHIHEQVDKGTAQIMELAKQAQMIGGVIDIIEEISENTNLLSLNAAIEAAGAGEAGKRFSVVASEVRRLANNTLEATESVRKMVEAIRNSTANMVMLAENEQKAVTEGVTSVQRMGEYFGHILQLVETTRTSSSEIGLITRQQSSANQQMVTSIQDVEKVAREVESGVRKIELSVAEINQIAARLAELIGIEQRIG